MSPEVGIPVPEGLLVAVVGPSGAGKDTLIRLALARMETGLPIHLARRVITRASDEASEDHDSLTDAEFAGSEAAGAFCLTWRAHGLAYGLPVGVERELGRGALVLANLSRRALADALRRFGRLAVVEITAPRDVLVARIAARGRESPAEIEARLRRQGSFETPPGTLSFIAIDNSGAPEAGAEQLRRHLATLAASHLRPRPA